MPRFNTNNNHNIDHNTNNNYLINNNTNSNYPRYNNTNKYWGWNWENINYNWWGYNYNYRPEKTKYSKLTFLYISFLSIIGLFILFRLIIK